MRVIVVGIVRSNELNLAHLGDVKVECKARDHRPSPRRRVLRFSHGNRSLPLFMDA